MSKTPRFGEWPLLERLTNDEFLEILQHICLEQYVLTQVLVSKNKWIPLLDVNLQTLQAKCGVCNKQVRFEDIKSHFALNDHLMLLRSNVKQFYNPFYTYGKTDINLAKGEDVPHEVRENALREVNNQIKCLKNECSFAKQFSEIAERRSQAIEEEQLIEKYLAKKIVNPDEIAVIANLPLENISKLQFCTVDNEWQVAFAYKNLTRKSTFNCKICSVCCCGIESLNAHLNGHTHKSRQLELMAIRYDDSSRVNKNCCIQFGNSFSFSIKEFAKNVSQKKEERNFGTWISQLPKDVAKKIKALNEHVTKVFACSEKDKDDSHNKKGCERTGVFETNDNFGHLGVEYVLKIIKTEKDKDPTFECGLCKFVGDGNKMQRRHILTFDHRKKYLDLHYSDTIKKYESLIGHTTYKEYRAVMSEIINKVAIEIENHHSRSLPYTVSLSEYKNRRKDLIAEVYALLHASQIRGPSFSNVVSKEEIIKLKKSSKELIESKKFLSPEYVLFTLPPKTKTYLNQMSHDPLVRFREYNAKLNKNRSLRASRSFSPVRDRVGDFPSEQSVSKVHDRRIRSKSPIHRRTRSPLRKNNSVSRSANTLNHNIWDIYRREISIAANEIEIAYENYRKNPESHPLYETEWNNFWQRRKKELEHDGYDHRSYNFQPEWVLYFKQRIEVLFGESLHNSQINIRHRLGIPLDAEEDCQRPSEVVNHQYLAYKADDDRVSEQMFNLKGNKRQQSPNFELNETQRKRIFLEGQEDMKSNKSQILVAKINDNHSNVIHVLRLMTALEEHLGSLGGKIMDLLSKALQLEKCYPENNNEFEAKVLTVGNCNLLETAMEKLKGILFAGFLDEKKMSGFSRVITYTENLLQYAGKMGWRQENTVFDNADFRRVYSTGMVSDNTFDLKGRNDDATSKLAPGKPLSDTLIDLAKTQQTFKQQLPSENRLKQNLNVLDCPPPPNLKEPIPNSFAPFKGHIPNSGLASFDTKLSLDNNLHSRLKQRETPFQPEISQLQRKANSSGNNIYNNSFKTNNEAKTNVNSRTKNGANSQSLISKIIPKIGQNNNLNQGVDGGNRNQNWLQWNQMN